MFSRLRFCLSNRAHRTPAKKEAFGGAAPSVMPEELSKFRRNRNSPFPKSRSKRRLHVRGGYQLGVCRKKFRGCMVA